MELMILLIIAWLLSPIVLGIICIVQRSKIQRLEYDNEQLRRNIPRHNYDNRTVPPPVTGYPSAEYPAQNNIPPSAPPINTGAVTQETNTDSAYRNMWYRHSGPDINTNAHQTLVTPPPSVRPEYNYAPPPVAMAEPVPEKKGPSAVNIILILGALFITLAGFVFAAATWGVLGTVFKSVVLLSFSAVFFMIHLLAERKLKLETTGKVFYALGSAFLPAAVAAAGLLKVFGDYFSFSGEGRLLIVSLMAALLSVCLFKGAVSYKSRGCARGGYGAFTCFAAALMIHAGSEPAVSALMLSLYALAALLVEPAVSKNAGENVILKEFGYFVTGNTWILAAISLFLSDGGTVFIVPTAVFSAAFFINAVRRNNSSAGTCACAAYLLAGAYLGIRPDSFDGVVFVAAMVMIVYTCLSLMNVIPEKMRHITERIHTVVSVIVITAGFIGTIARGAEITVLISAAAVFLQLAVISYRNKDTFSKNVCFGSFIWLAAEACLTIFPEGSAAGMLAFCGAVFAYFLIVKLTPLKKIFYGRAADILTFVTLFICIFAYGQDSEPLFGGIIIWLLCIASAFISGRDFSFGRSAAVLGMLALFYPMYLLFNIGDEKVFALTSVIYCITAAVMLLKPFRRFADAFSIGIPFILAAYLIISLNGETLKDIPVILSVPVMVTICSAVRLVSLKSSRYYNAHSYFLLGIVCFTALEMGRYLTVSENAFVFPAAAMLFLTGAYIFPADNKGRFFECIGSFLVKVIPVYGTIIAFVSAEELSIALLFSAWALAVCGCAVVFIKKKWVLMCVYMSVMQICTYIYAVDISEFTANFMAILIITVCCFAGRLFFRDSVFSDNRHRMTDFLTLSSYFGSASMLFYFGEYSVWLAFVTAGLITLNLLRRDNSEKLDRIILTAASVFIMPIWWSQPFFTVPDVLETELFLLPAVIVCMLLRRIHKESPRGAENISFGFSIAALLWLCLDAAGSDHPADAVILGIVIFIMLAVSFMRHRKSWFVLSVAAAVAEALLLTIKLWNSKLWWLYLLIAGAVLIGIGMTNEINKQKRKNGEQSEFSRFMSEWWIGSENANASDNNDNRYL